ncbi:DNA-binding NarL/FixJ family response regulator [Spinactinospora alkalitolerans]|uniref:DNA-binding NarL/FixJ family response regulator n=1 Tax=Spinactinospora alkalitolerans TaxID=687207 RepID=A0A852TU34_9ACTN|nr:response regulator transcription factor [Spinactinospora alkalitolerans]NYE47448.1 DNA-binding NarL/FixJ family response regulator [Spinactinospora alkalitolerans]
MIRVLIADDEPLVRRGLRAIVDSEPDLEVVGEAEDGVVAVEAARSLAPDVVLMDIRMPRIDGIHATQLLGRVGAGPAVLIVTTFENDDYVYGALRCGARGFLLKRAEGEQYADAIRTVHRGDSLLFPAAVRNLVGRHGTVRGTGLDHANLTEREHEVLRMMARGLSNVEIAEELVLGVETIKTHVRNVLTKLGVRSRIQAVIAAYESGFVPIR